MNEEERDGFLMDPRQWNRYAYVSNNPLVYTDPTGLERYHNVSAEDEKAIRTAIDLVLKHGNREQKRIAQMIRDSNVVITVDRDAEESFVGMTERDAAQQAIIAGKRGGSKLTETHAADYFTITLAGDDVNNPTFGRLTLESTIIHEGQHVLVQSEIIAAIADNNRSYDISFGDNEYLAKLRAAEYLANRTPAHKILGVKIGLLTPQPGGGVTVPAGQIRATSYAGFQDPNFSLRSHMGFLPR